MAETTLPAKMPLRLRPANAADAEDIARIHLDALPSDLLPQLGHEFLATEFYPGMLADPAFISTVALRDETVCGFLILSRGQDAFTDLLTRLRGSVVRALLRATLRRPLLPFSYVCSYIANSSSMPAHEGLYEVCFIATDEGCRGHGVGAKLMDYAKSKAFPHGRSIVVWTSDQRAANFYRNSGFSLVGHGRRCLRRFDILVAEPQAANRFEVESDGPVLTEGGSTENE